MKTQILPDCTGTCKAFLELQAELVTMGQANRALAADFTRILKENAALHAVARAAKALVAPEEGGKV
jgi:hypothetical protein